MKVLLYIFILLLSFSCSTKKQSYWCGDHVCISKSEKEAAGRARGLAIREDRRAKRGRETQHGAPAP